MLPAQPETVSDAPRVATRSIGGEALIDARATLDALLHEVVLLDRHGNIVFANRAWRRFAEVHGCRTPRYGVGVNYLVVCDQSVGAESATAARVAAGLRAVLYGERSSFTCEYTCQTNDSALHFELHAARVEGRGEARVLLTHEDVSDRKGAETTLRFALERFRAFMDNSPAIAFLKDENGRLVWVNQPFAERCGQPVEQRPGTPDDLFAPDSAATLRRNDAVVLAADRPLQLYETIRTPDGTAGEWLVMKFPVRDITGARFIGGMAVDVTEQRRAAEALRESEARLRLMAEQLPAIVITTDRELRFTFAIGAGLDAIGLAPEQIIGRTMRDVLGASPANKAALDSLPRALEGESLGLDAEWGGRDFQVRVEPLNGDGGQVVGIVAVAIDFTERKRSLRERADNATRMATLAEVSRAYAAARLDTRAVVETTVRVISETMHDGCVVTLADPATGLLKRYALHHADPRARALADRLLTDAPGTIDGKMIAPVMRDGRPLRLWFGTPAGARAVTAPEHSVYLDQFPTYGLLCVPLRVDGANIGVLAIWRDRADQPYTAEDEVLVQGLADRAGLAIANARIYEEVEQRVRERTQALEISNRELEAFSYSVSHDLRAPLRAISGFARILSEDHAAELGGDGQRCLTRVIDGAGRMEDLIESLLRLSYVTRTQMARRPVSIGALARDAADELRRAEPQRRVELTIDAERTVHADERLLRVVMVNLLGNAWKYSARRDLAHIAFGVATTPAGEPMFFVRDDGAGFDMQQADKLFDAFHRLHPTSEFTGSGIGLATVQRIIQRHGGRIWAESAPDQGATFFFTLPGA